MSRYQPRRTRRTLAWARRPSLATRLLGDAAPANDMVCETQTLCADDFTDDAPSPVRAANDGLVDEEPPFDPPDADDDIFHGRASDEEEAFDDAFAAQAETHALEAEAGQPDLFATACPVEDQGDIFAFDAAPEAPPIDDDACAEADDEFVEDDFSLTAAAPEEEPPFDAPDDGDDVFGPTFERLEAFAPPLETQPVAAGVPAAPPAARAPASAPAPTGEAPAPPIQIHASWDRPEIGKLLESLAADHRLARADIDIARGGIDSAVMRFSGQPSPNLLIIDTTLRRAEMLASLDRLAQAIDSDCKIIILGALNDIGLLRELALRGVSEYIVPPLKAEDLARAVCRLYARNDQSRVIAVIGARGGVGASTIAHNLAWSIAERQDACAALIELDCAFGGGVFNIGRPEEEKAVADLLSAPEAIDDDTLARVAVQHTKHLQSVRAPATLERLFELAPETVERLVRHARRANPYVVLDLPHVWNAWVKQTLANADEVVLVAAPDLASMRNTKSMVEALAPLREGKSATTIALSMVGVPKRPEINAKDFTGAVGAAPAAVIAFDPMLFGQCETNHQMLGEAEPLSKAALALDALAATLTGRKPVMKKRAAETAILARDAAAHFAKSPKRGARDLAAPANGDVLVLTRETSIGNLAASFANEPESEYIAKARSAAQADLEARKQESRRPFHWARVGLAAGVAGLALAGGVWRAQNGDAPVTAAPAAAVAAPTPEAQAPSTHYASALLLIGEGRVGDALPLLRGAAEAGFAPAQHRLAKLYERGEGVAADPALARAWTERAAANGNVRAMHDLGVYYAQGEGEAADASAAFRWFRQAAELGLADSQYNLGVLYHEGRGAAADAGEALFWFYVAAAQGDTEAAARAAELSAGAPPLVAEQAQARARAFRPRAPNAAANAPA
jgi:pilus assembly protein CpaE